MSRRHLGILILFLSLAVVEILLGLSGLDSIRNTQKRDLVDRFARDHASLAGRLSLVFDTIKRQSALLGRSPLTERALTKGSTAALDLQVPAYLETYPAVTEVTVFDALGQPRYRCQRDPATSEIASAVAHSEERLPRANPKLEELLKLAREQSPRVVVGRSTRSRDNVTEQTFYYVTAVAPTDDQTPLGYVSLSAKGTPLFESLQNFEPLEGTSAWLCDANGNYLEGRIQSSAQEVVPTGLLGQYGPTAGALLGERRELRIRQELLVSFPLSESPALYVVAALPDRALSQALGPVTGEYYWVVGSTTLITLALVIVGYFFVRLEISVRDLERDRIAQRQLQVAERLSTVGILTAGVAHEINNPLEGISNYLALLDREDLGSEKQRRYLERVRHGFDRIERVVSDLLDFAKPEVRSSQADLGDVVTKSLAMVEYTKSFSEVTVEVHGLEESFVVDGDSSRLEQVVLNLLLNAAEAMQGAGRISIEASAAPDGRAVNLVIADTGPGIPEENLKRIFDPFFTTKNGNGFGLAVSYSLVRAHGGKLNAANGRDGGARFTVQLPLKYEPELKVIESHS